MFKVVLSEQGLNNLKTFMSRVSLTGTEVPAFVEVINSINTAVEDKEKVEE